MTAASSQGFPRPTRIDRVLVRPRVVLAIFCFALLVFALTRTGRSAESVDVRTYVEMTRAIALHGVPYFDNGPADRFIALRSPFNLYTHGHLWGIYGPVYPYYAALPFKIGGLRLASIATCALLIPLALVAFQITRRLLESSRDEREPDQQAEWFGVAAAILVVLATPALGKSLELSAYPLAMLLAVAAAAATLEAVASLDARRRLRFSAGAGVLFAAGSGTHLLCLPMSMALLVALALCDGNGAARGPSWLERTALRSLWPTRGTLRSAMVAAGTMIVLTLPLALLNHVRFGSWNPFSYGPVPWRGMNEYLGASDQTISAHLRAAFPVIVLALGVMLGWLAAPITEKRWLVRTAVIGIAFAALLVSPVLRQKAWTYTQAAYAFIVDQSLVEMPAPYRHLPGTIGYLHGPYLTKSPLQCTPLIVSALFVATGGSLDGRMKQKLFVVLAPTAALFAYLTLRGNLPLYSALGVPWAYIRYTLPALPMLIAAAMFVGRNAGLSGRHWKIAATIAFVMAGILWLDGGDAPLYRQIIVLVVPLGVAALVVISVLIQRWRTLPPSRTAIAIAVACGVSIGIGVGHDFHAHVDGKTYCDRRADAMRNATPMRFAMFGYHPVLDPVLAVTMERDVEYADLAEGDRSVDDWQHVRPLLDHWFEQQRPVFFVANDANHKIPWPEMQAVLVDPKELIYQVVPRSQPLPTNGP